MTIFSIRTTGTHSHTLFIIAKTLSVLFEEFKHKSIRKTKTNKIYMQTKTVVRMRQEFKKENVRKIR